MKQIKWKDVFNCDKVFPKPLFECQKIAKSVGYEYISFNGLIYSVDSSIGQDYICTEKDLNFNIISNLSLKEKAETVDKLTFDIVNSVRENSFTSKSEKNDKIGGLISCFGDTHYINYAGRLNNLIGQTD